MTQNNLFNDSILFDVDAYKVSHWKQYVNNTVSMQSYIEARSNKVYPSTLFFGLQMYLKNSLTKPITLSDVEEANKYWTDYGEPFPYEGWKYIANELGGKLPVRIRAVQEGIIVPVHNALVTVESTDPKVFWVASWLETSLLRIWYPITVATRSYNIKQNVKKYLDKTADNTDAEIDFYVHNFGSRGSTSMESSAISGLAHLVSFKGTDNSVDVRAAQYYYNTPMAGFSIPAMEHSSVTCYGRDNEVQAYRNMLNKCGKPGGIVAMVADSYDIFNACENIFGGVLKQEIIDSKCKVVIRADSGDPKDVLLKCFQILDSKFGHTINTKGYKVINNVKLLQGDGIDEHSINDILDAITKNGYSAQNIGFGSGSGLSQTNTTRDTLGFAMKCSSVRINGKNVDVFKDPITDTGKRSMKGRLDLIINASGEYKTLVLPDGENSYERSVMKTVYENGEILQEYTLDEIRARSNS